MASRRRSLATGVYVGGSFANAVSPAGATRRRTPTWRRSASPTAALDTTFHANFGGSNDPMNPATAVNALATDGASLFVGGDYATLDRAPVSDLVKLTADGAVVSGFTPKALQAQVLDLELAPMGRRLCGGRQDRCPTGRQPELRGQCGGASNSTTGAWTGWFAGASSKVEHLGLRALGVKPDTTAPSAVSLTRSLTGAPFRVVKFPPTKRLAPSVARALTGKECCRRSWR